MQLIHHCCSYQLRRRLFFQSVSPAYNGQSILVRGYKFLALHITLLIQHPVFVSQIPRQKDRGDLSRRMVLYYGRRTIHGFFGGNYCRTCNKTCDVYSIIFVCLMVNRGEFVSHLYGIDYHEINFLPVQK